MAVCSHLHVALSACAVCQRRLALPGHLCVDCEAVRRLVSDYPLTTFRLLDTPGYAPVPDEASLRRQVAADQALLDLYGFAGRGDFAAAADRAFPRLFAHLRDELAEQYRYRWLDGRNARHNDPAAPVVQLPLF